MPHPTEVELHVFSDASKDAYAAAAYLVCQYENNPTSCHLITSKSRVAPLKAMTIPRLELMGAVLATRLANSILKTLTVDKTSFWTDSTNVLHWVRNQSRCFKPFVANRIGEIQRTTNPEQWRHIPGVLNPADLPTRGLTASELADCNVWLEEPAFLTDNESSWPDKWPDKLPDGGKDKSEERKNVQTYKTSTQKPSSDKFMDPKNYSRFLRLIRVTAW